ncbi:MAG: hypothetical protein M0R46_09995 [Candidatus Muirbacterium halophilum]|nr:hypothetical protein [Candidatus Muirbacterium halophilum]
MGKHNNIKILIAFIISLNLAYAENIKLNNNNFIKYNGVLYFVGSGLCRCKSNIDSSFEKIENVIFEQNIDPMISKLKTTNQLTKKQIEQEKEIIKQLEIEIKLDYYKSIELYKQANETNKIK